MSFFNPQMLNQARDSIKKMIAASPENIIIMRKPMVSDGVEGMVIDPFGIQVPYKMIVLLSHEKKLPENYNTAPVGLSTNLARYITADYETNIYDGDTFDTSFGKEYKIGAVDPLIKFNGVIGYQAPLIEAITMGET